MTLPTYHASMWWAYAGFGWCGFYAPLPNGFQWVVRHEMTFHREVPETAADRIKAFARRRRFLMSAVILQPDLFPKPNETGEFVPETFRRNGVPVRPGGDNLDASMSRVRSWLEPLPRLDGSVVPSLLIHADCVDLIRALRNVEKDPENPESIADTGEINPVKALGLFVMSRPMPKRDAPPELPPGAIGHDVEELRRKAAGRV